MPPHFPSQVSAGPGFPGNALRCRNSRKLCEQGQERYKHAATSGSGMQQTDGQVLEDPGIGAAKTFGGEDANW